MSGPALTARRTQTFVGPNALWRVARRHCSLRGDAHGHRPRRNDSRRGSPDADPADRAADRAHRYHRHGRCARRCTGDAGAARARLSARGIRQRRFRRAGATSSSRPRCCDVFRGSASGPPSSVAARSSRIACSPPAAISVRCCCRSFAPPVAVARYVRASARTPSANAHHVHRRVSRRGRRVDRHSDDARGAHCHARRARHRRSIEQPGVFESIIPPDRRRFRSQPGGVPTAEALWTEIGSRTLVELDGEDFVTEIAQHLLTGKNVLIDASTRLGCVCSGAASRRAESARSASWRSSRRAPRRPSSTKEPPIDLDLPVPAVPRTPVDVVAVRRRRLRLHTATPTSGSRDGRREPTARPPRPATPTPKLRLRVESPVVPRAVLSAFPSGARCRGKGVATRVRRAPASSPRGVSVILPHGRVCTAGCTRTRAEATPPASGGDDIVTSSTGNEEPARRSPLRRRAAAPTAPARQHRRRPLPCRTPRRPPRHHRRARHLRQSQRRPRTPSARCPIPSFGRNAVVAGARTPPRSARPVRRRRRQASDASSTSCSRGQFILILIAVDRDRDLREHGRRRHRLAVGHGVIVRRHRTR